MSQLYYYSKGLEKFNLKDYKLALEYFQAYIEENPTKEDAYLLLSDCFLALNNEKQALSTLHQLLAIDAYNNKAKQRLQNITDSHSNSNSPIVRMPSDDNNTKPSPRTSNATRSLTRAILSNLLSDGTKAIPPAIDDVSAVYNFIDKQNKTLKDIKKKKKSIWKLRLNLFSFNNKRAKITSLKNDIRNEEHELKEKRIDEILSGVHPIKKDVIKGRIAFYSKDQEYVKDYVSGRFCKRDIYNYQKHLNYQDTLSIRLRNWQMLFYSTLMVIEKKNRLIIIPYGMLSISYKRIRNYHLDNSYGYEVIGRPWFHSRVDGGPDRRYNNNFQMYNICRHQIGLQVKGKSNASFFLMFDTESDANAFKKILNVQTISSQVNDTEIAEWFKSLV